MQIGPEVECRRIRVCLVALTCCPLSLWMDDVERLVGGADVGTVDRCARRRADLEGEEQRRRARVDSVG